MGQIVGGGDAAEIRSVADGALFDALNERAAIPVEAASPGGGFTFFDINTFFSRRAGGIRAFYEAKVAFFNNQTRDRYVLAFPGSRFGLKQQGPQVTFAEAYGPVVSKDPSGYRFMLDYAAIYRLIRCYHPEVIEVGDPWLTGLFCLAIRSLGLYRGTLSCFLHSDPILTHLDPWSRQPPFRGLRRLLVLRPLARLFYRVQRAYDLTVVSSAVLQRRLAARGVDAELAPLGVPGIYLDTPLTRPRRLEGGGHMRLLYVGRLNREKGIAFVRALTSELPNLCGISLTVVGRGGAQAFFESIKHPRFRFLGFIEDSAELCRIYDEHDILLAPGPHESFGLSVVEAMARGLVIVGPDTGGVGELLESAASPFIFKAGDYADFRKKLDRAISCDKTLEVKRSRQCALRVGSLEHAMGGLLGLYKATRLHEQLVDSA
jgi:glycosyltransferase involved in cell wall biosynthesis